MNPKLADLYDRHAAASFDKQLQLHELVAELPYQFTMDSGELSFGDHYRWQAQLLGTESHVTKTWLWTWANTESRIPASLLRSVSFLRAMGEMLGVQELHAPQFSMDELDGHFLAMLAAGVGQASAYYRLPYEEGALFLLIADDQFPRRTVEPVSRMLTVFPQALQNLPITNHKRSWHAYLRFYGLQGAEADQCIRTERGGEPLLTATFDGLDRLVHLEGKVDHGFADAAVAEGMHIGVRAARHKPLVALGPEMPGWGSWDWVGTDLQQELGRYYDTVSFRGQDVPDCDVLFVIKHPLRREVIAQAAKHAAVIYCPIDAYGSSAEIEADAPMLQLCDLIVVHCEQLRQYFVPYAPVVYLDHHVKFITPLRNHHRTEGPILWVGARSNLPPLVDWVNAHPLPAELLVLTNPETPGQAPSAGEVGFLPELPVRVLEWSPERHLELVQSCRAALDIKDNDFRALHKPPAKAVDFIASGLPLAMNADSSSVAHLAQLGFDIVPPLDVTTWLSQTYWEETNRFALVLRELLSLERIGKRCKRIVDGALSKKKR